MQALSQMNDQELIGHVQQHQDAAGFSELYQRYAHLMLGWSLRYLKDQHASEDAVMEIMEQLMQNIHKYKINDFKNWLFLVTRNHCFAKLKGKTEVMMDDLSQLNQEDFVEKTSEAHLHIEKKENELHEAIERLKDTQRTCIVLFYFKKKSYKEIAMSTGIDEKKVKSHIQNGKRNLRTSLQHIQLED
ncbi:MAG: sigma-70 family RNA polymerase sigma factor [Saprospiraceae bacterium]|nr:sigma-70 family RNA polymerase sigma factor [Saprospiraceae bacterium]